MPTSHSKADYIRHVIENDGFPINYGQIEATNIKLIRTWEDEGTVEFSLHNFQNNCIGPDPGPFFTRPCPHNTIITLQTAYIRRREYIDKQRGPRRPAAPSFPPRCVACVEVAKAERLLKEADVMARDENKPDCDRKTCFKQRF